MLELPQMQKCARKKEKLFQLDKWIVKISNVLVCHVETHFPSLLQRPQSTHLPPSQPQKPISQSNDVVSIASRVSYPSSSHFSFIEIHISSL